MAMPDYATVAAYIAAQTDAARPRLTRMRNVIRKTVPRAVESISYKIPTYKLHGRALVFFAAWKEHLSLYPASSRVFEEIPELSAFKHAKDTVRFRNDAPLPVHLVARFAKVRELELDAEQALARPTKPVAKKPAVKKPAVKKPRAR
jgi:uncharacterized protein YdhG (YjbR/CyaY superfamily)